MPDVDWPNKIINVYKADMVLIDPGPPREIYQLDTDALRLALKDLEDDEQGMAWPDTHQHNTPVTVSGVTLARVIEFINGYVITFENDNYAVNLVGSNNNIADVVTVNLVQVRSNNSTGLQDLNSLQAASFSGAVAVDLTSSYAGSVFPVGTRAFPVNNWPDALAIAVARGIPRFLVVGSSTLDTGDYSAGYTFTSDNPLITTLTVPAGADISGCTFDSISVTGTFDMNCLWRDCQMIAPMSIYSGIAHNCAFLTGTFTLTSSNEFHMLGCWSNVIGGSTPVFDFNGSGANLGVRGYNGGLNLANKTGAGDVSIDMASGQIIIENTCTAGTIRMRGIGTWTNRTTYTGTTTVLDTFIEGAFIAEFGHTIFNRQIVVDVVEGASGTDFPLGTSSSPSDNLIDAHTIAEREGLDSFLLVGSTSVPLGLDFGGHRFEAVEPTGTVITLPASAQIDGCSFANIIVTGQAGNGINLERCQAYNLTNVDAIGFRVALLGTITLKAGHSSFLDSWCVHNDVFTTPTVINFNGQAATLEMHKISGEFSITNCTNAAAEARIFADGAQITIDNTCTNGTIELRGVGVWANRGSYSGGATVVDHMVEGPQLRDTWRLNGLDASNSLVVSETGRSAGTLTQSITQGASSTTVLRTDTAT